jgi:hypothetical protein
MPSIDSTERSQKERPDPSRCHYTGKALPELADTGKSGDKSSYRRQNDKKRHILGQGVDRVSKSTNPPLMPHANCSESILGHYSPLKE